MLLLLEVVELLLGLGVAIVVLESGQRSGCNAESKLRPLSLQTGHCASTTQLHHTATSMNAPSHGRKYSMVVTGEGTVKGQPNYPASSH